MFHSFEDYAADLWSHARRIITKVEITKTGGSNIRYVVTNMTGHSRDIYHGLYTQRGNVPERPIGELKNGLHMDRLSSHRFLGTHQVADPCAGVSVVRPVSRSECKHSRTEQDGSEHCQNTTVQAGAKVKAMHRRIWFKIARH